jgi:hypothetical protein
MAVPVPGSKPDGRRGLGKARGGEGNRPWSAGAGSGALATGLAQGAWMLRQLSATVSGHGDDTARIVAARSRVAIAGRGVHYRGRQTRGAARGASMLPTPQRLDLQWWSS